MPELQRRRKRYQVVLELTSIVATRCGQPVMDKAALHAAKNRLVATGSEF
jgi:hypothetical protein